MSDILDKARDLGKAIQEDECFINLSLLKQNIEKNEGVQNKIKEFNLKKLALNNEVSKETVDRDKINRLNHELIKAYDDLNSDPNMILLNEKKDQLDNILREIIFIITKSSEGEDPDLIEYTGVNCAGNCESCSGC